MQIWDEISSDLPSITLAHMVWGCKEAMAPQPLWSTVDFREGSSVHRSFSARASHQIGASLEPASLLNLSPQDSLAFGTQSFEKNS